MQRDSALVVVLALLALLALGVAAATLNDPVAVSGEGVFGGQTGDDAEEGRAGPNATTPSQLGGTRPDWEGPCLTFLDTPTVQAALFLALLALAAAVHWRVGEWLLTVVTVLVVGLPVYVVMKLLSLCGPLFPSPGRGAPGRTGGLPRQTGEGNAWGADSAVETVASQPTLLLSILLVAALVAALVLLVVASGNTTEPRPDAAEERESEPEPDAAAVGRAAGRAADRIDAGDEGFENEIYRAWVEMTDHLTVDHPASSTPAEFADAAVAAGLGADDVAELTTLFEEVRYGDRAVTDDRESRAVAALRRIEKHYADANGDTDGGNSDDDGAEGR